MTAPTCARCHKPTGDSANVCIPCTRDVAYVLAMLPRYAVELATTVTLQARAHRYLTPADHEPPTPELVALAPWLRSQDPVRGLVATRLGVEIDAADTARKSTRILVDAVLWVSSARQIETPALNTYTLGLAGAVCEPGTCCQHESCRQVRAGGRDELPSVVAARWLLEQLTWLRHHPDGSARMRRVEDAASAIERAIDRSPDVCYAGPCSAPSPQGGTCDTGLYAEPGAAVVKCRECGSSFDVAERREFMAEAAGDCMVTAIEASRALTALDDPVSSDRIRQWAKRGQIFKHPDPYDPEGPDKYRLRDIQMLLANARERSKVRTA